MESRQPIASGTFRRKKRENNFFRLQVGFGKKGTLKGALELQSRCPRPFLRLQNAGISGQTQHFSFILQVHGIYARVMNVAMFCGSVKRWSMHDCAQVRTCKWNFYELRSDRRKDSENARYHLRCETNAQHWNVYVLSTTYANAPNDHVNEKLRNCHIQKTHLYANSKLLTTSTNK